MVIAETTFEDIIDEAYWNYCNLKVDKEYRMHSDKELFKIALRKAKNKEVNYERNL